MAKEQTIETVEHEDITPADSVVPVYLIPLTPEEEAEREQWAVEQAERDAKAEAAIEHRANAIAKLAKLGLTVDEINAAFNLS